VSRANSRIRGDIQYALSKARRVLEREVAESTGANSEPVKQAALALARTWRKVLSVPGLPRHASPPGSPPESDTKRLRKSIRTAVIEGTRRVGTDLFTARLHEFGYHGLGTIAQGKRKGATRPPVPPRPHAQVAFELAKDAMTEVFVSTVQHRIAKGKP